MKATWPVAKAHYVMVGGFLGAGKTTAILNVARHLRRQGLRVGLITNDQSYGLVDTAMLNFHDFPVEEITGGCFCCKFKSLVEASERLTAQIAPDIFIAEPVGSCTDLKATVDYPLRRIYGDDYAIAPLSVLVDPIRALRVFGLETGKSFSKKVAYIYQKQLEEADIIVVNKIDLLSPARLEMLCDALRRWFPRAQIQTLSARTGLYLEDWVKQIMMATPRLQGAMDVDYGMYAEGEALLGWLNCTVDLKVGLPFDGNNFLLDLGRRLQVGLGEHGVEVAHLKMTLTPHENGNDISVANLVRSDSDMELSHTLQEPLNSGQLIVNLRAEADPAELKSIAISTIEAVAAKGKISAVVEHAESFRPGKPTPTHRLTGI